MTALRNALVSSIESDQWRYYDYHPEELKERYEEEFLQLVDILGLKNTWEWVGAIALTVVSSIENDPELMALADEELKQALKDIVKEDINPFVRIKKIGRVFEFVKKNKKIQKPLWRWHTWRYSPKNLTEKLALEQAMKNPSVGKELWVKMTDKRWLWSDGWVKMSQNINWIEIHYVFNKKTKQIDDFKFKN